MTASKLADFTAFLSLSVEDDQVFEAREGRVVITEDSLVAAGKESSRRLSLETLAEFDFRTVPDGWEQFFDDLVGIRFERPDGETTLTVGTESTTAVRFVTLLLKLALTERQATVRQHRHPLEGEQETVEEESAFRLLPKRECIRFDGERTRPIAVSAITNLSAPAKDAIELSHLSERGRIRTTIRLHSERARRLFRTYLEFRTDLADYAGPVRFVYLGENRNMLSFVARRLDDRGVSFEAGHAHTVEDTLEALDSVPVASECLLAEYDLPDATARDLAATLAETTHEVPLVVLGEREAASGIERHDVVLDAVRVGSDADQYDRVAAAIERAAVMTRL